MEKKDVVIIGGGPAGLAAAVELHKKGIRDILILERERHLGGILRQCIHDGFGLSRFHTTLSGPEYAARFIEEVKACQIPFLTETTVLDISPDKTVISSQSSHPRHGLQRADKRGSLPSGRAARGRVYRRSGPGVHEPL